MLVQIGLKGEELGIYEESGDSSIWISQSALPKNQPLVWYKVSFIIFYLKVFVKLQTETSHQCINCYTRFTKLILLIFTLISS